MRTSSRRDVLRLLGLAGLTSLLPSFAGRAAIAKPVAGPPRRLLFFFTEQGTFKWYDKQGVMQTAWRPSVPGLPDATKLTQPFSSTTFTLGDLHGPLVPFQKRLLFLDGLDMRSNDVDPTGAANAHIAGETHAMIAANRASPDVGGGISIDQYIAKGINSPTPITKVPSLEMEVKQNFYPDGGPEGTPLYAAAKQPMPWLADPGLVYERLLPMGPMGQNPDQIAAAKRALAQQTSVLDYAQAEFGRVSGRAASSLDRQRLDAHASAIRDLEQRLGIGSNIACTEPDKMTATKGAFESNGTETEQAKAFTANADVMFRLATLAFACDLTRVATIHIDDAYLNGAFGYVSVNGTSDFHDMIHKTNGVEPALINNPQAVSIVKAYHTYNAKLFANLLAQLDAIPTQTGTLLDETLVVWCGQLAGGDHSLDHIPYILAGGMGGAVTMGRYVMQPRKPDQQAWPNYSVGPAHNDFFVSLANLMGIQTSTFGNPQVCKGPLAGLT